MGDASGSETSIDRLLEKHWAPLTVIDRAVVLKNIGIDGKNENFLGGMTVVEVLQSDQDDLPSEVRGRLIMAVTAEGFSKKEFEKAKESMRGSKKGPERG